MDRGAEADGGVERSTEDTDVKINHYSITCILYKRGKKSNAEKNRLRMCSAGVCSCACVRVNPWACVRCLRSRAHDDCERIAMNRKLASLRLDNKVRARARARITRRTRTLVRSSSSFPRTSEATVRHPRVFPVTVFVHTIHALSTNYSIIISLLLFYVYTSTFFFFFEFPPVTPEHWSDARLPFTVFYNCTRIHEIDTISKHST